MPSFEASTATGRSYLPTRTKVLNGPYSEVSSGTVFDRVSKRFDEVFGAPRAA
jgi:hypothetical protein